MKILVVGSGGREHTMVWKLAQSPRKPQLYCAPGNAGIESLATCVPVKADDIAISVQYAQVGNATDIERDPPLCRVGKQAPVHIRHQGSSLPTERDIRDDLWGFITRTYEP